VGRIYQSTEVALWTSKKPNPNLLVDLICFQSQMRALQPHYILSECSKSIITVLNDSNRTFGCIETKCPITQDSHLTYFPFLWKASYGFNLLLSYNYVTLHSSLLHQYVERHKQSQLLKSLSYTPTQSVLQKLGIMIYLNTTLWSSKL
jgi:hypothetical protein